MFKCLQDESGVGTINARKQTYLPRIMNFFLHFDVSHSCDCELVEHSANLVETSLQFCPPPPPPPLLKYSIKYDEEASSNKAARKQHGGLIFLQHYVRKPGGGG